MFGRLLPRCGAALPAVAGVAIASPDWGLPQAPQHEQQESRRRRSFFGGKLVACDSVAAVAACSSASLAPPVAAGGADAFRAAYDLEDQLGQGTFGIVQRARHRATGQRRAVKRLQQSIRASAHPLEEAKVLASMDHPNIVGLYEYFQTEDEVVLVQELCEGVSLQDKLGPVCAGLQAKDAAVVLRQMLVAVQHCHERGFVHRDLKADNFVFDSSGPDAQLKLIDFGLASRCGRGEALEGRAGTVDYSPPEALRDDAAFGLPADVWALGAVLFLMLTGEPLIKVDQPATPSEELRQILQGQAARKVLDVRYIRRRLMSAAPRLPDSAVDLLEELLQPDPQLRITVEQALQHPFILEFVAKRGA